MGLNKRIDMELKKEEKCLMLKNGRIVRFTRMRSIRCYEYEEERDVWWGTI